MSNDHYALEDAIEEIKRLKAELEQMYEQCARYTKQGNDVAAALIELLEQSKQCEARLRGLLERARVALSIDAAALTTLQEDIYEALTDER